MRFEGISVKEVQVVQVENDGDLKAITLLLLYFNRIGNVKSKLVLEYDV